MNSQGQHAELAARKHLEQQGLCFVASNVRFRFGEIDLIMKQQKTWVFVEVKYRNSHQFGGAINALTQAQIGRIRKAASAYLQQHNIQAPCRFDVVAIEANNITWLKNAF
ncbi:YraN family protein [Shewanella waksmanii]|uniref:YraN family protein n=1 Tax=Shewanella waksmanii TaxID=213783 RepID=UPI00048A4E84|nr:YraN family protein [Shewanella waksmanii]